MISAGGVVEEIIVARIRCCWKKFRELLLLLTFKVFLLHLNHENLAYMYICISSEGNCIKLDCLHLCL